MIKFIKYEEALSFVKNVYKKESKEFDYFDVDDYNKINLNSNSKFIGYYNNLELLSVACVYPLKLKNDMKFLNDYFDYYISNIRYYYKDRNYANLMLIEISKKHKNYLLLESDNLESSIYENVYKNDIFHSPFSNGKNNNFKFVVFNDNYLFPVSLTMELNNALHNTYRIKRCNIDINKFSYFLFTSDEVKNLMYDKLVYTKEPLIEDCGNYSFMGFHYFKPSDIYDSSDKTRFLVCVYNTKIVGLIKVGNYSINDNLNYFSINYIDVHKDFKKLGIAKNLYRKLNNTFGPNTLLISTDLSEEGKKADLVSLRKSIITNFLNYNNKEDFYKNYNNNLSDYCLQNNERMKRLNFNLDRKFGNFSCFDGKFKIEKVCYHNILYYLIEIRGGKSYLFNPCYIYDNSSNKYLYVSDSKSCNLKSLLNFISSELKYKDKSLFYILNNLLPLIKESFDLRFNIK